MKKVNYRKIFAIKIANEKKILDLYPKLTDVSGIYIFHRINEFGFKFYYAGKSVKLLQRVAQHLTAYDKLGASLRDVGLYNGTTNTNGWKIEYYYCNESKLDCEETKTIAHWHIDKGYIPFNKNTGGTTGKSDMTPRITKGYQAGLAQGYKKAQKYVASLFEKNLIFSINGKDGINKQKAYDKFLNFIEIKE